MAARKDVKKDIRAITEQIMIDAIELSEILEKEEDKKKAVDILIETVEIHNSLIARANHPDGKDNPKLIKVHFNAIYADLMEKANAAYEKIGALLPKE